MDIIKTVLHAYAPCWVAFQPTTGTVPGSSCMYTSVPLTSTPTGLLIPGTMYT